MICECAAYSLMPPCGHKSVIAGLNTFNDFKECQILSPYLLAPFVVVLTHFNASSSPPLLSPLPQTAGEWAQVLQLQRQFHQAQLSKWQQILQSSVTLLDQVCVYVCVCVFLLLVTCDVTSEVPYVSNLQKIHAFARPHV